MRTGQIIYDGQERGQTIHDMDEKEEWKNDDAEDMKVDHDDHNHNDHNHMHVKRPMVRNCILPKPQRIDDFKPYIYRRHGEFR